MRKAPVFGKQIAEKWESHAEQIITELLETIISAFESTLSLNKLEGDAAFFFVNDDGSEHLSDRIVVCMQEAMNAFSKKASEMLFIRSCPCDPCQQTKNLRLKIFAHKGEYQIKKIRHFE